MQREIKFRVWDNVEKRFVDIYEEENCHVSMDGTVYRYDRKTGDWTNFQHANGRLLVQQYTGLKDSKGKEIYEGDIVTIGDDNPPEYSASLCVVENHGAAFCYQEVSKGITRCSTIADFIGFNTDKDCFCEIIGNIFETPELLQ